MTKEQIKLIKQINQHTIQIDQTKQQVRRDQADIRQYTKERDMLLFQLSVSGVDNG